MVGRLGTPGTRILWLAEDNRRAEQLGHFGRVRVEWQFLFGGAAYNALRLRNLPAATV